MQHLEIRVRITPKKKGNQILVDTHSIIEIYGLHETIEL